MIYYRERVVEAEDTSTDSLHRYLSDMKELGISIQTLEEYLKKTKVKAYISKKQTSDIEIHFDIIYDASGNKVENIKISNYSVHLKNTRQEFKKSLVLSSMILLNNLMSIYKETQSMSKFTLDETVSSISKVYKSHPEMFRNKEYVAKIADAEGYIGLSIGKSHDIYLVYTPATVKGRKAIESEGDIVKIFFTKKKEILDKYANNNKPYKMCEVGYAIDTDNVWKTLEEDLHKNNLFVLNSRGKSSKEDSEVLSVVAVDSKGNATHFYCKEDSDINNILNSKIDSSFSMPFTAYQTHSMSSLGIDFFNSDNDSLEATKSLGHIKFSDGKVVEATGEISNFVTEDIWNLLTTTERYSRKCEESKKSIIPKEIKNLLPSMAKMTKVQNENKVEVRIVLERI